MTPNDESVRQLWEVHVVFGMDDVEMHLVVATGQEDALKRYFKNAREERTVQLYRAEPCTRYKTVTIGHRSY
jgi:hypothetical protein